MILMTAPTGTFGREIVKRLATEGVPCRTMVRNPERVAAIAFDDVEITVGDMTDPKSLVAPLEGVDRVFLNAPMVANKEQMLTNVIEAAAAADRPQIVLLTGGVTHNDALGDAGRRVEQRLDESGLEWVKVGPQTVMETNLLAQADGIKQGNVILGCAGDGHIGMVALDDVVDAFVAVLTNGASYVGREFIITGPEAITYAEIAAAASRALDRTITYQDMPEPDFRNFMVEIGAFTKDNVDMGVI